MILFNAPPSTMRVINWVFTIQWFVVISLICSPFLSLKHSEEIWIGKSIRHYSSVHFGFIIGVLDKDMTATVWKQIKFFFQNYDCFHKKYFNKSYFLTVLLINFLKCKGTYRTAWLTHHFHLHNLHICCTFALMKYILENYCHMWTTPHNKTNLLKSANLLSFTTIGEQ